VEKFKMSETELSTNLLELLVCPLTKGPLEYDKENNELISKEAKLAYPIRDGIPIMLVDEARDLSN
jgi:uncharacterized protein YbaR (Trm112 family)|tara:strand:- start:217 stop:414 length:198 start_codon:yes stop_codon:yes gene_type:complete